MMRLFVALEIPGSVRREIDHRAERVRRQLPQARWVASANLHLTLAFFGATEESLLATLNEHLAPAFAAGRPLVLRVGSGGTFPPHRPAQVAWISVEEPESDGARLARLQRDVTAAAAAALGGAWQPDKRPFRPHLTLARAKSPWRRPEVELFQRAFRGPVGSPFRVDRGILFQSFLGPGGSRYEPVESYPLGPGEAA